MFLFIEDKIKRILKKVIQDGRYIRKNNKSSEHFTFFEMSCVRSASSLLQLHQTIIFGEHKTSLDNL